MPLSPVLEEAKASGAQVYWKAIPLSLFALDDDLAKLSAIEDVLMIGYPNGLWDSESNLPIVRRGITASPPYRHFKGRREFVIDCACYPGSSGSPIFLYRPGLSLVKTHLSMVRDVKLLGVLWGVAQRE